MFCVLCLFVGVVHGGAGGMAFDDGDDTDGDVPVGDDDEAMWTATSQPLTASTTSPPVNHFLLLPPPFPRLFITQRPVFDQGKVRMRCCSRRVLLWMASRSSGRCA